jgi:hypothetical protein
MSCGFYEDLMSEPPGGHQHGRKRGGDGGWIELEENLAGAYEEDLTIEPAQQAYHRPVKPEDTIAHGTFGSYNQDGCRCEVCRTFMRDYRRQHRLKKT